MFEESSTKSLVANPVPIVELWRLIPDVCGDLDDPSDEFGLGP